MRGARRVRPRSFLDTNLLEGTIPDLGNLTALQELCVRPAAPAADPQHG